MTLDEAIKHCLEVAEQNETEADWIGKRLVGSATNKYATECRECAADHRQLAAWLGELKEAKRLLKVAVDDLKFESQCRNCKHQQTGLDNICNGCRGNKYEWRYADEALNLIES